MKKLILSDLDNTLLPIHTQKIFADMWFRDVARKFYEHGIEQSSALNAMNDGVRAMIFNDGSAPNSEVFYEIAVPLSGCTRDRLQRVLDDYYATLFHRVHEITLENPYAIEIARLIRAHSKYAVIATMPLFPIEACDTRMRWVGLRADMFDLVTSYDVSSYCKPNPLYYQEILDRFGVKPSETLMIGNDVREDMIPCEKLGIDTFLVTDHMLDHGLDCARFRQGSYPDLITYLQTL